MKNTQREIKFRAWNYDKKEMIRDWCCFDHSGGEGYESEYKVMQYTGLKDKNGREIYEADILRHDLWGVTHVIFEHGMFRAVNDEDGNDMVDVTMADHQLRRTRIIGNIYENPELLKS